MKKLFELFISFFKIGLFTFGGGGAMIALLQDELVRKRGWLKEEDLLDYFAVAQCTPGIIAINTATMAGYEIKGKTGSAVATFAVVLPSLIIITLIAAALQSYMHNEYVVHAFNGIRAAVVAIIANVVVSLWKKNIKSIPAGAIFIISLALLIVFSLSPIWTIIIGCLIGLVWQFFLRKKMQKRSKK